MQSMPIFTSELMERLHLYIRGGALKSCIHNLYSVLSPVQKLCHETWNMHHESRLNITYDSSLEVFIPAPTWGQVDNIQLRP